MVGQNGEQTLSVVPSGLHGGPHTKSSGVGGGEISSCRKLVACAKWEEGE